MAKTPSKTPATGFGDAFGMLPALFPVDRLMIGNGSGLEAWTEMSRTLMERLGAWQAETTRFVAKRLEEDLSSQRELAACRTPTEAAEVCSAFTRKVMQDYLEEAGKAADLAGEITRACAVFGESLAGSAVQAAKSGGLQAPAPMAAAAKAAGDGRAEIAA